MDKEHSISGEGIQPVELEFGANESFESLIRRFIVEFRRVLGEADLQDIGSLVTVPIFIRDEADHERVRRKFDATPHCLRRVLGVEAVSVHFINPDKILMQFTRNDVHKILNRQTNGRTGLDNGPMAMMAIANEL